MGLDGLSIRSLGLSQDKTSLVHNENVKESIKKNSQFMIKDVDESVKKKKVVPKNEEEQEDYADKYIVVPDEEDNENNEDKEEEKKDDKQKQEKNNVIKKEILSKSDNHYLKKKKQKDKVKITNNIKYKIYFNQDTNSIEIIDPQNKNVIESIDVEDLSMIIKKLQFSKGLFINTKI